VLGRRCDFPGSDLPGGDKADPDNRCSIERKRWKNNDMPSLKVGPLDPI